MWSAAMLAFVMTTAATAGTSPSDEANRKHRPPPTFAISNVTPNTVGNVDLKVVGSGFEKGATVLLGGTALATSYRHSSELTAKAALAPIPGDTIPVTVKNADGKLSAPFALTIGVKNPKVTYGAAYRFLEQATWGPTTADVLALQQTGFSAWLAAQQSATPSIIATPPPPPAMPFNQTYAEPAFMYNALNGPDQLRQRVAFALGQVFVISGLKIQVYGMVPYLNLLSQNAFGNYKDLMTAVTLSPSMGHYLDMVNNDKPNPAKGTLPNENYAREFMQLFTIGTDLLNPDGSLQLDDSGQPIPTYTETDIQNMARVLTGWTYPTVPGQPPPTSHNPQYFLGPMIPVEKNHDVDSKTVLGTTLPAGQTAEQDLAQVVGIVFNHPNVGPFVALRLIEHLVTSNPSPAYVQRISAVFANNGSGVRGDLTAVVNAILLDPEARLGDTGTPSATGGHLREPVLYATAILRGLGAAVGPSNLLGEYVNAYGLGQELLFPASVFNYYSPFSRIPGGALAGPEFQLLSPSSAVLRANWVIGTLVDKNNSIGPDVVVDLSPFFALAGDDGTLLTGVNMAFYGGQMPADVHDALKTVIDATTDPGTRAFDALFIAAAASEYQVQQ